MAVSSATSEYAGIVIMNMFMLAIGATLDFAGILLWSRKVPPNGCVGVKIRTMGDNQAIWYEVNEYAGKVFCMEGLFLVMFSLMYMALPTSFSLLARVLVFAFVFVISLGGAIFLCVQRAKLFANPSLAMSGHDDL